MKKKLSICFITFVTAILLTACSGSAFDPSTAYKGQTAKQLYDNGMKQLKKTYYQDSTQFFRTLDARFPYSPYTSAAQLDLIYAYYMNDDDPSALLAAERFIHLHPTDPNVDYAYYMRALINFDASIGLLERHLPVDFSTRDLSAAKTSFAEYNELVHRFPQSRYVPDALQRMTYLRNLIGMHNLEVGQFYYNHRAYVAAINRALIVVQHYQQVPFMPQALTLLYNAYNKLQLTAQAQTIAKIYKLNYPKLKPLDA